MIYQKASKIIKKMLNNTEFQEIAVQEPNAPQGGNIIEARYNFLLSEQPNLYAVEPQRVTTQLLGGCFASLLPIYVDYENTFADFETLAGFIIVAFVIGSMATRYIGQFLTRRNQQFARVQNIELLKYWKRPIIILPESRFDCFVDARTKDISDILNDEKCLNVLNVALTDAEICFDYSIQYGFRTGESCQTNTGLPVVSLFPELFILRGAFDDVAWFEFQKEAVRIALEIDRDFAKQWYAIESHTYRTIAGGQLMI